MAGQATGSEGLTDDVFVDDVTLLAADGYRLAATLLIPRSSRRRAAILINPAIASPRQFYRRFASYLAARGFVVLTYDYRGTGDSRPKSLKGFSTSIADWAARDVTGAISWVRSRYPHLPLGVVGHSFGGQAIGLAPNNQEIKSALLIAALAAYWKLMASPERYRVYALMKLGMPLTRVLGYAPTRRVLGADLPEGVFRQWSSWVLNDRYFFNDPNLSGLGNFERYKGDLRALCIADDPWGTRPAVEMLCAEFKGTTPEILTVEPMSVGAGQIGHLGFFRPQHRDTLWKDAADWLLTSLPASQPAGHDSLSSSVA